MLGAGPGPILRTNPSLAPVRMNSITEHLSQLSAVEAPTGTLQAADTVQAAGIDQAIESFLGPIAQTFSSIVFFELRIGDLGIPLIVVWLMAAAVFLTIYLRFQPVTGLKYSLGIIRGRFTRKTDPGQVSSFQALATELSGTVGLGNIAGVAVAITVGGPGAALWIIIFGFFAMTVKMAEATLGVKYRRINDDGTVAGGPMYYLRDGLAEIGRPKLGKFLAAFYALTAVIGVIGAGNLFQANQAASILVVIAVLTALVILGGIRKIGQWTSKLPPMMAILYFLSVIVILIVNAGAIPGAFVLMVEGAFSPDGIAGGIVGVAIVGIQRALFSNAAGIGSAAMAHHRALHDEHRGRHRADRRGIRHCEQLVPDPAHRRRRPLRVLDDPRLRILRAAGPGLPDGELEEGGQGVPDLLDPRRHRRRLDVARVGHRLLGCDLLPHGPSQPARHLLPLPHPPPRDPPAAEEDRRRGGHRDQPAGAPGGHGRP